MTRDWFVRHALVCDAAVALKHMDGRFGVARINVPRGQIDVWDREDGTHRSFSALDALIEDGWAID